MRLVACILSEGGIGLTVTVTLAGADPPGPEHDKENVVDAASAPVLCVPDVATFPVQPPDATQVVALLLDQVS
jgi:hypothetical protein